MHPIRITQVNKYGGAIAVYLHEAEVNAEDSPETEVRQFLGWWWEQCRRRGLPIHTDSIPYRIVRNLLPQYGLPLLKAMATYLFENQADVLREDRVHPFIFFSSRRQQIEAEMKELGLWQGKVTTGQRRSS